ncbi:MAG: VOC family protein [Planctomycetaceae bacterium]|nr:VOC family protein [Planctomycetaceae bacterium]
MSVKPIPDGYHSVTPYLICRNAAAAIDYYTKAFGARERMRLPMPGGLLGHAELEIGDSVVMLADENQEWGAMSPQTLGGTPASVLIYVEDVDTVFQRAIDAGAKVVRPLQDQFYGDRSGHLEDPFGHRWSVATHVEDVSPEELQKRMQAGPDCGGEG